MTISLPPEMVEEVEKVRKAEHRTRSELLKSERWFLSPAKQRRAPSLFWICLPRASLRCALGQSLVARCAGWWLGPNRFTAAAKNVETPDAGLRPVWGRRDHGATLPR